MNYMLHIKTADATGLKSAIDVDAKAADSGQAQVPEGIGLRSDSENAPRGSGVDLVTLLLTIPVGVTVEVAAEQIKRYLCRKDEDHRIRKATIRWTEEMVDADGNVKTNPRGFRIELDEP